MGGVPLHPLNQIRNVSWGGQAIVVFVDMSDSTKSAVTYEPIKTKAKFLKKFFTPYQQSGIQPGYPSTAYRLSVGECIKSTVPTLSTGDQRDGLSILACVFAINRDLSNEQNLDRAVAGTKLIIPALYLTTSDSSDLPAQMAPPGLLWLIETGRMKDGQKLTWKLRYGAHRDEGDSDLPNNMMQCYPLGPPFNGIISGADVTWTGYMIYAYRLDKNGTGTVYAKLLSASEGSRQNIDPAWNVPIIKDRSDPKGIPMTDPPPLVAADLIT